MSRTASLAAAMALMLALPSAHAQTQGPLILPGAAPQAVEKPREPVRSGAPSPTVSRPKPSTPASPPAAANLTGVTGRKHFRDGNTAPGRGELEIVAIGAGAMGLRFSATGRALSANGEQCVISLGADQPAPMLRIEEPYRNTRYRLQSPVCPMVVELLGQSVRISIPDGECSFVQADCRLSPEGLWGPPAEELGGRIAAIERQRGRAERDLRDISRKLLRRLAGDAQREAAAEQAAFSSERTTLCRSYLGEDTHGFCAAELTSARAEILAKRYELTPERPARNR